VAACEFHVPDLPGGDPGSDAALGDGAPGDGPSSLRCSAYNYSYNGHKYRLVDSGIPWTQAKTNCTGDGGYLVKLESAAEDAQLASAFVGGPPEVWIGLNDADNDGLYLWTDGTAPSFTNWNGTPPDAGNPDCVVKDTNTTDGRWSTKGCNVNKAVVCECTP
jgi:C-type mannose receptor